MPPRASITGSAEVELAERLGRLAIVAADLVTPGMVVGLGSGSTADAVLRELGTRVVAGLRFRGVPTSHRTEDLARELGIELTTLEEVARLDLGYDGADEIDPQLGAIKGKGGALLREKLVALSCDRFVLVATTDKLVQRLGERTALPVEIVSFGWKQTAARLTTLDLTPSLRPARDNPDHPAMTDNGGYILDCATGPMDDPARIAAEVKATTGVVDHGLFLGVARTALLVDRDGKVLRRERPTP
jgi:ribose 5-phosphate isomerase A